MAEGAVDIPRHFGRRDPAVIRRFALAAMAACALMTSAAPLVAATLADPATGVFITVPAGYTASRREINGLDFSAAILPTRRQSFPPAETTTSCLVSFNRHASPPAPDVTQQTLNATLAEPAQISGFRARFENRYILEPSSFVMLDDVQAVVFEGSQRGSPESLLIGAAFNTRGGTTSLTCIVWPPDWPMLKSGFRKLLGGIKTP